MPAVLITLNAFVSLISAAAAVVAAIDPRKLSGSQEPQFGERYYARLYAIRSVPVELAAGVFPLLARSDGIALLLLGAAMIQAADVVVAIGAGKRSMMLGASWACLVHLLCAFTAR